MSQGTQVASRKWERQEMVFSLEPPERTLNLARWDSSLTYDLQNCKIMHFCFFKLLSLWYFVTVTTENQCILLISPCRMFLLCSNMVFSFILILKQVQIYPDTSFVKRWSMQFTLSHSITTWVFFKSLSWKCSWKVSFLLQLPFSNSHSCIINKISS